MNRKVLRNPMLQKEFQKRGFVKLPMLSNEEVNTILSFIHTLRPDDAFNPDGKSASNPSTYHCTFLDTNIDYKKKVSDFLIDQFSPYTNKILYNFKFIALNFYVKQPGTGKFQIHQNWPVMPVEDTSVTVWCPLVDVSENNGGIQIVESSHKIVPDIAALGAIDFFRPFEDVLVKDYLRPVMMKAGEVLIFDDSLLHWSSENNSDSPRYAIQIMMVPEDVTPLYFHYDSKADRYEIFAVDADFFINSGMSDLMGRPKNVRSLGFVPNPNRELTLEQFIVRMKNGPARRAHIYGQRTLFSRAYDKIRRTLN
jgi:Phytanoyl-CoA dioxygenase (PhyH)